MKKNPKDSIIIMACMAALLAVLFLAGCQASPPVPGTGETGMQTFDPEQRLEPGRFESIESFNDFFKQHQDSGGYAFSMARPMVDTLQAEAVAKAGASETAASTAADYSKTNIQVEGVDEADILKTDGEYIYTLSGKTLFIVKAYPGEDAEVVSEIKFENQPRDILISQDALAVFGDFDDLDFFKDIGIVPRQGMSFFRIYDISDQQEPELVKDYKFEGRYFEARLIGSTVYFITMNQPDLQRPMPMPLMIDGADVKYTSLANIHYYPIPYDSASLANIHALSLDKPGEVNSESLVVEHSQNMYMSKNNIYITYTKNINEWEIREQLLIDMMMDELTQADQELVQKIRETDPDVLTEQEKKAKITRIISTYLEYMSQQERDEFEDELELELKNRLEEYEHLEYTLIHKIKVDDMSISIDANNKVPGHVINQFSMDEHDGVLRIATTLNPRWSRYEKERAESVNNVYALDSELEIIGKLEGLAETERIYSTRFMGDRLYMVTFRQVDPFFVIDLSNPAEIKELGRLKIPGYSRYLHPYDQDTIIGIGRDASETGRVRGLKISLFDVSDVENPDEVAKFVSSERYAQSTAEYEHKAFLFDREKELLVIPAYSPEYRWDEENQAYNGAMVFRINQDDIEMRGIIDHSMAKARSYGPLVERSLYIDNLLYTKSPSLIRINSLQDLSSVKNVELEGRDSPYPVY